MKAIIIAFTLKGQDFGKISSIVKEIKNNLGDDTILIHGFMPRSEVIKRCFSTEVVDLLEDTFPLRLNMYNNGPLREEMAKVAQLLKAESVYVIGEIKEGVAEEVEMYKKYGFRIMQIPLPAGTEPIQLPSISEAGRVYNSKSDGSKMIKDFRMSLDGILNSFVFLNSSREVSLAVTSLQRGFSWLGEALKESGSQSPYVESENANSDKIEPQADKNGNNFATLFDVIDATQTARVKYLRSHLSAYIIDFKEWKTKSPANTIDFNECLNDSLKAVKEAKIWLGWELGRIRDAKEKLASSNTGEAAQRENIPL